jgi:hypothetical protein
VARGTPKRGAAAGTVHGRGIATPCGHKLAGGVQVHLAGRTRGRCGTLDHRDADRAVAEAVDAGLVSSYFEAYNELSSGATTTRVLRERSAATRVLRELEVDD